MRQYSVKGYIEKNRVWVKRKKTLESDAGNHEDKFCHPTHDDEQQQLQQQQQQQYSNTLHSSRQVYTSAYSYVVQQRTVK